MNALRKLPFEEYTIGEVARRVVILYFKPFTDLLNRINPEKGITSNKYLIDSQEDSQKLPNALCSIICYNQGAILEYSFLASLKHKRFKENRNKPQELRHSLADDLLDFLNFRFYEAAKYNFELLNTYFVGRSPKLPRLCIKGFHGEGEQRRIVDIFRDINVGYRSDIPMQNNSGFEKIVKTGTYFFENNLPKACIEGRYKNPRLNLEKVQALVRRYGTDEKAIDRHWIECWHESASRSNSDYYKSTMIIPMTLWNNSLSSEFVKEIKLPDAGRTIFGFLCFDHSDENYFSEKEDVKIAYVVADLLSMYLFVRLQYSSMSESLKSFAAEIGEPRLRKVKAITKSIEERVRSIIEEKSSEATCKPSSDNTCLAIDDSLIAFSQEIDRSEESD